MSVNTGGEQQELIESLQARIEELENKVKLQLAHIKNLHKNILELEDKTDG